MKNLNFTKNKNLVFSIFLFTGIFMGNAQNIVFPDPNFKSALLTHTPVIDLNGDGEISYAEAAVFSDTMNVSDKNIALMGGIQYFTSMTRLICYDNNLLVLDVSNNTALEFLHCSNNNLASLNVSGNSALKTIWASNNNLTSIDVSANTALESLSVQDNNLTELNVMYNSDLMYLECFNNNNLEIIWAHGLSLIQLRAHNNPNLHTLWCSDNELTELDLSGLPSLYDLDFSINNITSIDLSDKPALENLYCRNNNLTSLDLSNSPALVELNCSNNNLTSLNVANGNNANITVFNAINNDLTCIQIDNGFTPPSFWEKDAETDYCEAMSVNDYQTKPITFYPNPVRDKVFFQSAEPVQKIILYNLSGSKIKEFSLNGTRTEVSVSELPAGVYLAEIHTAKNRETLKIIKK